MADSRRHDPEHLISPDCNLKEFCYEVMHLNVVEIMETASAEITYHRTAHRNRTHRGTPRAGTRLRQYCDDLQELIRMLMNAHVSPSVRADLIDSLRPLMAQVMKTVRFNGNVEEVFSRTRLQSGGTNGR